MESANTSRTLLLAASAGWIILVLATGAFFVYGAPYYYQQGQDAQYAHDLELVDRFLYGQPGDSNVLVGNVLEITADRITIDAVGLAVNPLRVDGSTRREIVLSASAQIVELNYLSAEEYERRTNDELARALRAGEQAATIAPFEEAPASLDALEVGENVSFVLSAGQDLGQSRLVADKVQISQFQDHSAFGGQPVPPLFEQPTLPQS